jgi:uncharacterized protein YjdB
MFIINCGGGGSNAKPVPVATLQSIAVTPATLVIPAALARQFTATGTYSDGTSKDVTASATWTSGTTLVAIVSSTGLATGVVAGSSVITATSGTVSGKATLTITAAILQSIAVTPANPSISGGVAEQFKATGTYSDSTTQDITSAVVWTSGSTSVATMSATGLATGGTPGSSVITATWGSLSGSTTLTVTAATLQSIAVTPANPSITKGTPLQFTATGTYSDTTTKNITTSVTWTSGTPSVATIAPSGLAAGVAAGASVITAAMPGVSGTTTLTVTAATLLSIAITPASPSLGVGAAQQLTATGTYSDATKQNITALVTWASGTTSVATVTPGGLLSGVAAGTSAITATSGSVAGTTTATVTPAPVAGALTIFPNQVVSGVIDQNAGAASKIFPYLLVATGGNVGPAGYTWSAATGHVLPFPALSIAPNGVVSIASTALTRGAFIFYVTVSDGSSNKTAPVTLDLNTVCNSANGNTANPCFTAMLTNNHIDYLPSGKVSTPYAATIVTSGGTPPYTWTLGSGTLPPGITIDQAKGILRGTPTTAGAYTFYVLTRDSSGQTTAGEVGVLAARFSLLVN